MRGSRFYIAWFCCLAAIAPARAFAAGCVDPAAPEAVMVYNQDENVFQYCNGSDWIAIGELNPGAGGAGCSSPTAPEGVMVYNYDYHVLQYCDGDDWIASGYGGMCAPSAGCFTDWTKRTTGGERVWAGIASSSDNEKLVAVVGDGRPYTSTDGGATWTERDSVDRDWVAVASSADGQNLVAVVEGGRPYTSTNGGATWTERDSMNRGWAAVASSADGQNLVGVVENGRAYTSIDGGQNWTQQDIVNRAWYGVASSADGQKLIGTVGGDYMYRSTNGGASWSALTSAGQGWWEAVASSADGSVLFAARNDDAAFISSDSGTTWQIHPDMPDDEDWLYRTVAVSADGSTVAVARRGGNVEIASATGGNVRIGGFPSSFEGAGLALSSDGKKIAVAASTTSDEAEYIYTSECSGPGGFVGAPECTNDDIATCTLDADRGSGDPEFIAANIASGANILGVTGTMTAGGCSDGGIEVGGHCWYAGGLAQSCAAACSSRGLSYNIATRDYAGSGGTLANCTAVMAAVSPLTVSAYSVNSAACGSGYGCFFFPDEEGLMRCTNLATTDTAAGAGVRRLCACE